MLNTLPSSFASAVTPYAPLGRAAVGLESVELKASSFKPLEEGAKPGRSENRRSPEDQPNQTEEQERTRADAEAKAQQKAAEAQQLSERQQQISELAARDRAVRAHERAHAAVGGQYAGAPSYQLTRGPDGVSYAVAGEVRIDTAKVPGDPQASLDKALQVKAAANAPAEPSAQDRRVAAEASRMAADARAELAMLVREEQVQQQQELKAQSQSGGDSAKKDDAVGLDSAAASFYSPAVVRPYPPLDLRT
ncbi:putative metalloprotease CJM1_0395 family protein [Gilvimarinus agarilyticus]|uniref:putative metalloprotease CJM1_0395 family protein n=1 Tax=Gilvimarinus agarilyticus TaxID=679259 RepID=UPI000697F977|nr:putative metalloprotease CJM1_0395 family protein [Gilvimarinus agarilyticus]